MIFKELPEYGRDLKKLCKKYRSLDEDLQVVKKVLIVAPNERPPFSFRIEGLGIEQCIIKIKKIACKSLKGKGVSSGLRLVYAYYEKDEERLEEKIIFIELYHKNDKGVVEDRKRIFKYFR